MANVIADPGAGGATFATDTIAGVEHPLTKLEWGATGTANSTDDASGKRLPVNVAESALLGAVTETAPVTDIASSGVNGRLQRIAQRLTSLIALLPASLGQKAKAASLAVTLASDQDALPVTDNGGSLTVDGAVTVSGTATVSGTVTANAGANLNTSALALEAGGNLAGIRVGTDRIPAQGQALAASSLPVVLTAAQLTTLTPPAAIAGFATEATLAAEAALVGAVTETAPATDTASSGLNGRLQRLAQRFTSLIALLPAALVSGRLDVNLGAAPATVTITPSAALPITDNAGSLTIDTPQLPAALVSSRLDINLGASGITLPVSGTVTDGGSGKTLKTAVVALTASGDVVAAVSGKIIKVFAYEIQSRNDTMTIQLLNDLAGTVKTIRWALNAREGAMASAVEPPHFLFSNVAQNKPIYANITGTGTVDICARYFDDDAS